MASRVLKICGVKEAEHANVVAEVGASALGLMFAPSRRQITPATAAGLVASMPTERPDLVGVFVNAPVADLIRIRDTVPLDVLQLSGDEQPEMLADLPGRIWKVLRFPVGTTLEAARIAIDPWFASSSPVELILVDASVQGAYGGTGHRADWDLTARLAEDYPLVLAGGLDPDNVVDAIHHVNPLGVDVSSGVEREGRKDAELIRAFVQEATGALGT